RPVAAPRLRMLCLPFAGGGTGIYRHWAGLAPADVEILTTRLPGRETRMDEPPATDMAAIVDGIRAGLAGRLDAPLALFGHSMGAAIAHDLAHRLIGEGIVPAVLMVSGRRAPFAPRRRRLLFELPEPDFLAELRRL